MKILTALILVFILVGNIITFAQLTVKDQDATPHTLLQVNDEGEAGSITLPPLSLIGTPTNKLYNIGNSLFWNGNALGTAGSAGGWTDGGTIVNLTNGTDRVGIGTNSPATNLHVVGGMKVAGTEGVVFEGEYSTGPSFGLGAGTLMLWYPRKAAFRAGGIDGTQWDDANVGGYSIAAGYNTIASGYSSTAFGFGTTASGSYSTSLGFSVASGDYSAALNSSKAVSVYSTSIGIGNIGGGSPQIWDETDPIFEIGNGFFTPSNAMTVLKNGNVGIGIHTPSYKLDISGGNFLVRGDNGFTAAGHTGTVYLGSVHHYIKGEYGFGLKLGTYVAGDVISVKEVSGNVGINTTSPTAKLDVNGSVRIGSSGSIISEVKKITGTTSASGVDTYVSYPSGYTIDNTHILSLEVYFPNLWVSIGYYDDINSVSLHCLITNSSITIRHGPNFNSQPFRLVLMKIN